MGTTLDTPIVHGQTVTSQKIEEININLRAKKVKITVVDFLDDGTPHSRAHITVPFADIPAGLTRDKFVAVVDAARVFARNQAILGAGTDTDEMVP